MESILLTHSKKFWKDIMTVKCLFIIIVLISIINVPCYATELLYISDSHIEKEIENEIKSLEQNHIRVLHRFGRVLFIRSGSDDVSGLSEKEKVFKISDGQVNRNVLGEDIRDIENIGIAVWNTNYVNPEPPIQKKNSDKSIHKNPGPARVRPKISPPSAGILPKSLPYGASWEDTSEYFLHRIAVGIVLMESTGHVEDWTTAERDKFVAEAQAAMDWWVIQAPDADLSFVYEVNYGSTDHEPITESLSLDERTWIQQILTRPPFSYTYADPLVNATQYNNDLRDRYNTDWAFIIFAADDTNDADKLFADFYFGWGYYGGPWLVMTYGNDGYGTENLDHSIAHEVGHIFYAIDEYAGSMKPCNYRSGYLNYENQNSREGTCLIHVDCIMAELSHSQRCYYTVGQVGQTDSDSDHIPDILDTFPSSTLTEYLPDPTTNDTPPYTGSSHVNPLNNLNPRGSGHDITLNTISQVQYRVDSGPWIDADPVDAAFDSPVESFTFTTATLSTGTHLIQVRARNSEGNYELPPYPSDSLTIIIPPTETSTPVPTSTPTLSSTPSRTPIRTPTSSPTLTRTSTPVRTMTLTPTYSVTPTKTPTNTPTDTGFIIPAVTLPSLFILVITLGGFLSAGFYKITIK
ncbi:MAG: hypothetical protein A2161_09220 [Candidatus Schekmanbacteria bacterium RBG_13_48_7]|uniref:Uncharacterized protein n=1 Tax=Candidatus Schekmanbacteria bacterium RBG_13_48_7 TaxID=1817878 RepID=A0A1F7RMY9_9BACT|nr:MAG: hypothetical protein A2161_09220 [Candidatus Schekmanbacteria bacterium RBG_13_48_7]